MTEPSAPTAPLLENKPLPERAARKNNFDFLRLCFAAFVVLSHSPELVDGDRHRELLTRLFHTLSFGEVGVAGFFILSGYLISQSWEHSAGAADFVRKRVLRIYPGFIVAALFTGFIFAPLGAEAAGYFSRFRATTFAESVLTLGIPATPNTTIGNGSLWTIRIEFECYLLIALLGMFGIARRRAWAPLFFIPVALLFIKKGVLFAPYNFFGFFFSGATFYHFRDRIRFTAKKNMIAPIILLPAMMSTRVVAWLGVCTAGAYLLFAFAFFPVPALQHGPRRADLSYGTYLYAWPIQRLIILGWPDVSPWLLFPVALLLSMGCGWLSWHSVEKPFLALKTRRAKPAVLEGVPLKVLGE